jgi:hypothetical protein
MSLRPPRQDRSARGEALRVAREAFGRAHRAQKTILAHDELLEGLEERVRSLEKLAAQESPLRK